MAVLDEELVRHQCGVVTRAQVLRSGLTDEHIEANIAAGRWSRLYPGIYATFSGSPPRRAQLWAAVLRVGTDAILSHDTAAELVGLTDRTSPAIHVTVPHGRSLGRVPGVRLHRSNRAAVARHPTRTPPQSRVEETVIDLTQSARTIEDAVGWLGRSDPGSRRRPACDRSWTDGHRIRWRAVLTAAVDDIADGCHSVLERAYLRDVERAHGLPRADRQAVVDGGAGPDTTTCSIGSTA